MHALRTDHSRALTDSSRSRCPLPWSYASTLRGLLAALTLLLTGASASAAPPPVAPRPPSAAQDNTIPDQVYVFRKRRGSIEVVSQSGVVTRNSLSGVELESDSKTTKLDASEVQRVVFGETPPSFRDGQTYFARGDYENAAARFQVAATDAATRPVVQAAARLAAGESYLHWAASDPVHYSNAIDEFSTFFTDFPDNRELPKAERLHARALLCSGEPVLAATIYRGTFDKLAGTQAAEGYQVSDCLESGMQAAKALFDGGDTLGARELLDSLERALDAIIAALSAEEGADEAQVAAYEALRSQTRIVRDGYAELVGGNLQAAKAFFENQYRKTSPTDPAAVRFSTLLGLAEVRLLDGQLREAEMLFAKVAALDYADRDRVALALIGQAKSTVALKDSDSAARSKKLLSRVIEQYGDTPSAREARELFPEYEPPTAEDR